MILTEEFLKEMVKNFSDDVVEQVFNVLELDTENSNDEDEVAEKELEFSSKYMFNLFTSVKNFFEITDLIIEKTSGFSEDKVFVKAEYHLLIETIAYICFCGVESTDVLDEVINELEFLIDEDFVENFVELGGRYKRLLDSPYNHFQDFVGIDDLIIMYRHSFETLAELGGNRDEIIESCVARLCYFTELDVSVKIMVVE